MADELTKDELQGGADPQGGTPDPTKTPESTPPNGGAKPDEQKIPYDRFKEKVDEVNSLKEQLKAFEDAQEAARLAELSEVDRVKAEADKLAQELQAAREDALNAKKVSLLAKSGYSDEQITRYSRFVIGTTDEEIAASIEALIADVPPTAKEKNYADPSTKGAGARNTPKQKDLHDKGVSAFQRLKTMGRIK